MQNYYSKNYHLKGESVIKKGERINQLGNFFYVNLLSTHKMYIYIFLTPQNCVTIFLIINSYLFSCHIKRILLYLGFLNPDYDYIVTYNIHIHMCFFCVLMPFLWCTVLKILSLFFFSNFILSHYKENNTTANSLRVKTNNFKSNNMSKILL